MYVRAFSTPTVRATFEKTSDVKPFSTAQSTSFSNVFKEVSEYLKDLDQEALKAQLDLVTGSARNVHTAVLAMEKASLALDLAIAVRNKAIEAYQEIMRMPL